MKRGPYPSASRSWLLLSALLLVSLACSLPSLGRATRTPSGATPEARPAQPSGENPQGAAPLATATQGPGGPAVPGASADFPPALVEVEPAPRSQLSLTDTPIFYFNQPMERASVEAAFKVDPAVEGNLEWLDDATVRFVPSQPLKPETDLHLSFGTGARSAQGQSLPKTVKIAFRTAGPLSIGERLPEMNGEQVNPASAVVVTFTSPVLSLGDDLKSGPAAFTLEPEAIGRGEWLNTSTYIFYPQPALLGGSTYTVRLNPGLHSADGTPLAADTVQEWSFTTASPVLLSVKPTLEKPVELDEKFILEFNQPMDPASVEAEFSLLQVDGPEVPGKFTWNNSHTELTFTPEKLLERGKAYTLILFGTAKSQGGSAIGKDFAAGLVSVPSFGVTQTRPSAGETLAAYDGYATVTLNFGSPVAGGQELNNLVGINPPVASLNVSRSFDGYQLYLSGYFQPSTSYSLSVSPDLQDRWGARLGAAYHYTFSSQPAQPSLVIPVRQAGAQALFVPYGETGLAGYSTNITRLALSRGALSLADFIPAVQDWQGLQNWEGKVQSSWARLLYPTLNQREKIEVPLTQTGDLLPAGLYFLQVETQPVLDQAAVNSPHLLVVSPIQLIFKVSARQAFVWAIRISDYSPAASQLITIYDQNARPMSSCTTDGQGVCQAELPAREDDFPALFAVIGQPGDADFSLASSNWSEGVAPWEFGLQYANKGSRPEIYLYTDRPIYRPGQAVHFRAVVRGQDNGRYFSPEINEIAVDVVGPFDPVTSQSQVLTTLRLPLSPYGAASGEYELPEDARPGSYTLRPQNVQFRDINFEVAEYRKPEIDLAVAFGQEDQLVGSDIQAEMSAQYFFGAPAAHLNVRWSLFRAVRYPDILSGMSTGRVDTDWIHPWGFEPGQEVYLMEGEGQTDSDGKLVIRIDGEELRERIQSDAGNLLELTLEVTVEDESGLPVSARDTSRLHPAPSYIGLRPEQWTVEAGQEITFSVQSVDWTGKPLATQPLHARFRKVVFVSETMDDPYGPSGFRAEYTEAGSTDFYTSNNGEARLAFIPNEPGTYMIEVIGEDSSFSQQIAWVGGPGSAPWPNLANQRLLLRSDRQQYEPGQKANIFIPNPFPTGALALVTVERGKVMRAFAFQIQEASRNMEIPIIEEDAPNIYISVTLLGRNGRPDFRQGYLELEVDAGSQILDVEVLTSPKKAQPGEQVAFQVRVTNADGNPVQGEFSLALVDKAVLALAEPNSQSILEAFYGRQPLGVNTGYSLANYAGRFFHIAEGRGGGGGAGETGMPLTVRSEFEDTAYWNGTIETNAEGIAQVVLMLPDNLTTWQADVRGLTVDTEVGQAQLDLITSKPLLIRPLAPRFAVPGDHLQLAAVVHNNTQEPLNASVRIEAPGFTLDEPDQAAQALAVAAGGSSRVTWWGTVQDVPVLDLIFSVEAGNLQDAARPEGSPLPVIHYSVPQTFGTSGFLSQPGEKVEWVNLPRSFVPSGGELTLEVMSSPSATILDSLVALETFPADFTEPVLSRLLPNLASYQALADMQLDDEALRISLQEAVRESAGSLAQMQNEDGGWGWAPGYPSNNYITSYVLLGLVRASQSTFVDPQILQKGQDYLVGKLFEPSEKVSAWQLNRLAFQFYALQQSGKSDLDLGSLYEYRDKLSPWGKAFLALALEGQAAGDERARTLVKDLEGTAARTASGSVWHDLSPSWRNWSSANFTTAVVVYAIAQIDPGSQVLAEAVRYLVLNRRPAGAWNSSYETAWALLALVETVRGTGDLQANYSFSASLNGSPVMEGQVDSSGKALKPVKTTLPLADLRPDLANPLQIQHGEGSGRLYYRAFLRVDRPAQDAPAQQRGMTLTRQYQRAGQDCRTEICQPLTEVDLIDPQPLLVRLTLTVPQDMYYVVVEDYLPSGTEVLNPRLKTSQQNFVSEQAATGEESPLYDTLNPFDEGWGWWLFKDPQIYAERVRWVVDYLPAGTYELTYRQTPLLAGEFRVLPARAWQYYFPEIEGTSAGGILNIHE